ncbi:lysostaphin resistance A-like protein [Inhella sp.]|uniref:CPBP family intramembrane glutamic endopeptidase n=1 Tax=Inhella sp. TaxID=1921806 RepID=UPI0035B2AC14
MGVWAWVPTMLVFWLAIFLLLRHEGLAHSRRRFGPAAGSRLNAGFWSTLAVLVGLLSLPGFLRHAGLLDSTSLVLAWLVFALVNPWFEEAYWRGLLMDRSCAWGWWPSLLWSSAAFALSHPLIWGIHSLPLRKPEALAALFFVGLVWGLAYQRTHSLRWCVLGHLLANGLGLSALVLLNLVDPTQR